LFPAGQERPARRDLRNAVEADILQKIIRLIIEENPSTSTRRITGQFGVGHQTVWRTSRENGQNAFHKIKVHKLNPRDYPLRLEFCERFLQECEHNPDFPTVVLFSDEASFTESGIFYSKNNVSWAETPKIRTVLTRLIAKKKFQ